MRTLVLPVLSAMIVIALCASCEQRESEAPPPVVMTDPPGTTLPSSPFEPPPPESTTTRPDRAEQLAAVTRPVAAPPTVDPAEPTSRPGEPASTPASAVTHLLDLMAKRDVQGIRTMMAEPVPAESLRPEVEHVARNVAAGAKWEVVDSISSGVAAVVIVRTTIPKLKPEFTPLVLVNRYDRWKVILPGQQPNLRRYTEGEKSDMNKAMEPAVKRLADLRGVPAPKLPQAATAPPTTTTATATTAPAAVTPPP